MSVGVNELTKSIIAHGTFSPSKYAVSIGLPTSIKKGNEFTEDLVPRIQRVTLPEREISVIEQKSAYRETRSIPKGYSPFANLSMSILLSANLREKRILMLWQDYIINPKYNLNPSYVDSITTTITVTTLAPINTRSSSVDRNRGVQGVIHRFYDCYPLTVGDVELSYATTDEAATMDATFAYNYYTLDSGPELKGNVTSVTGSGSLGNVL